MCYTSTDSLLAFIANIVFSCLLLRTNNKELQTLAYFFLFVGAMQLWDYVFWKYNATSCVNRTTTKIAMIWNHLQPLVLAFAIVLVMKVQIKKESKIVLLLYTIASFMYSISIWNKLDVTTKTIVSGDALEWRWNGFEGARIVYGLFLLSLVILAYQHFSNKIGIITSLLFILSFAFSVYKYKITANTGRMWCYIAAFAPLIYLILN